MTDAKRWNHDALAHDLAEHLRANTEIIAWEDMQLGPSGSSRPDVYTIRKQYSRFVPVTYEVKVSVSDFRSDITSGKWQRYLPYCSAVIFAVPAGLIKKEDVPAGCGLIVRHDNIWRTVKNPTLQRIQTLPHDAWIKLVIDGIEREVKRNRMAEPRTASIWSAAASVRRKHGDRIGSLLSNLAGVEQRIEQAIKNGADQAAEIEAGTHNALRWAREALENSRNSLDIEYRYLAKELGLPDDATLPALVDALRTARQRLAGDNEVTRLRQRLDRIRSEFTAGLELLPGEANDKQLSAAGAKELQP